MGTKLHYRTFKYWMARCPITLETLEFNVDVHASKDYLSAINVNDAEQEPLSNLRLLTLKYKEGLFFMRHFRFGGDASLSMHWKWNSTRTNPFDTWQPSWKPSSRISTPSALEIIHAIEWKRRVRHAYSPHLDKDGNRSTLRDVWNMANDRWRLFLDSREPQNHEMAPHGGTQTDINPCFVPNVKVI